MPTETWVLLTLLDAVAGNHSPIFPIRQWNKQGLLCSGASQVVLVVKNPPANPGDIRDSDSIPGWGRSPGGGHGNPLQYSCLENPMDREAQWPTVHRFAQTRTRLKRLGTHSARSAFNQAWGMRLPRQSWSHRTKGGSGALGRQWVRSSCTWTGLPASPAAWPCPGTRGVTSSRTRPKWLSTHTP